MGDVGAEVRQRTPFDVDIGSDVEVAVGVGADVTGGDADVEVAVEALGTGVDANAEHVGVPDLEVEVAALGVDADEPAGDRVAS